MAQLKLEKIKIKNWGGKKIVLFYNTATLHDITRLLSHPLKKDEKEISLLGIHQTPELGPLYFFQE